MLATAILQGFANNMQMAKGSIILENGEMS
jgi:hypothetical protein